MKDEFAASRLPDLPNAGYSTPRERELSDAIMQFLRQIERDRLLLLDIVCGGKGKWRHLLAKHWRYGRMNTDLVDAMYGYLDMLARVGGDPGRQREQLLELKWSGRPTSLRTM